MIEWRTSLSATEQRQIRDVVDAATATDGVAPVGDGVLRELPLSRTRHLVAVDGEGIVGYLNLVPAADAEPMAEVVVAPGARRRGIGSELIRAGLAEGGADTRVWAHGNLDAARGVAAALDLVSARELWQMRRPLAGLPPIPAAPGIVLRTYAGPADDAELLRVNNAAFSWHPEQGGWTEADVAERRAESWFDPAGLFLAFDSGTGGQERSDSGSGTGGQERSDSGSGTGGLLGFHWTKVHGPGTGGQERSDSGNRIGEVYVVGVDPAAQGRGLGALLTLVGIHHLGDQLGSAATVMLYVEANNSQAVKTYERLHFEVFSADVAYTTR
jgi:mycothiol synthase